MSFGLDSKRMVSIARQPILDPKARVFGYQLLHDCGPAPLDAVDSAAARTLTDAVLSIGVDPLSCGHPLFITLTRSLLLGGAGSLLPQSTVVILDESIRGEAEIVKVCQELRAQGYGLSLHQFGRASQNQELLPLVQYATVDLRRTAAMEWKTVAAQLM